MSTATELRKAYKDKEAPIYEQCQMYRQRCDFLEQLCCDMYVTHVLERDWHGAEPFEDFTRSMKELGLLEELYE